jgi:hypothetical protein
MAGFILFSNSSLYYLHRLTPSARRAAAPIHASIAISKDSKLVVYLKKEKKLLPDFGEDHMIRSSSGFSN